MEAKEKGFQAPGKPPAPPNPDSHTHQSAQKEESKFKSPPGKTQPSEPVNPKFNAVVKCLPGGARPPPMKAHCTSAKGPPSGIVCAVKSSSGILWKKADGPVPKDYNVVSDNWIHGGFVKFPLAGRVQPVAQPPQQAAPEPSFCSCGS